LSAEPAGLAVDSTVGPAGPSSEVAPTGTSGATTETAAASTAATALSAAQRARRERIVQAAISLLESGEYDAIQMRDVAATAGVALATVYRYFSSKEHLYAAALLDWSRSFAERADVMLEGGSDEERLRELLRRIVRAFERWPQMLRAEVTLTASQDPQARASYAEWATRNRGALEGALPTLSAEDAAAVVDISGTVLASRLREWAFGRCSIDDVHDSVQRTVDMIFTFPVV
jgi:AcrR family transcriptional regulator